MEYQDLTLQKSGLWLNSSPTKVVNQESVNQKYLSRFIKQYLSTKYTIA